MKRERYREGGERKREGRGVRRERWKKEMR